MAKKKTKPPSREKYEMNNPTVSARMPSDKRAKLQSVLQRLGLSLADLLISIADEKEIKLKSSDEAREEGYKQGYRAGYEKATGLYQVTYPCPICGKPVSMTSPKSKALAGNFMAQYGGGHAECHKKKPAP